MNGESKETISTIHEPFGLILQDGGKLDYLPLPDRLVSLLEPHGLLVTDDILFPVMDIRNPRGPGRRPWPNIFMLFAKEKTL